MGRQGDERFERFVGSRTPALLRYACVLTGDPEQASRLVQASLADAARRWREVEDAGGESVVQQQVLERYLARQRGHREDPGPDAGQRLLGWAPDPQGSTESRHAELVELVDALDPRRRAVLVLRHVHGLDDDEIADRTGVKAQTVAEVGCGAAGPWIEAALRAHEDEGAGPADPVDWVYQRVGGDRRRAVLVASAALVLVVLAAAVVVPHLGRPSAELVSGLPPSGTGLLRWPTAGEQATDALRLGKATDAWTELAKRGERPAGSIYALASDTIRGIPVVVLEATDEAGDPRVALLVGYEPSLAASDVLTPGSATDALLLPASLVAGIPRVFGDVQNDGLILAPRWRGDDERAGQEVGWQRTSPSPIPSALPSLDADVSTWQPLDLLAGSNWLALLSSRAEGVVVLSGRGAGGAAVSSTLQLPEPGSESLVLERGEVQFKDPQTADRSADLTPGDYDLATAAWRDLGRAGPLQVRVLGHTVTSVARRGAGTSPLLVVLMELAGPGRIDPVLVQRAQGPGADRCAGSVQLPSGGASGLSFVASACSTTVLLGRRTGTGTVFTFSGGLDLVRAARVTVDVMPRSPVERAWRDSIALAALGGWTVVDDRRAATGTVTFTVRAPGTGETLATWQWPRP